MIKQKESELTNEAIAIIKESEKLPYMTKSERIEYMKKIQEIGKRIRADRQTQKILSDDYPIMNKNDEYTGTYFKILIGWAAVYNTIENIISGTNSDAVKNEVLKLQAIKNEVENYYYEAISDAKNKKIKRNMELGKANLNRFFEYGNATAELIEIGFRDGRVNEILKKKENSYIFWLLTTEKGNELVVGAAEKIEKELKQIDNENSKKALDSVKKIKRIFS